VVAQTGKRHVPPSRKRYQSDNPAVSTRISLALNAHIEEVVASTGLSKAKILRMGLEKGADLGDAYKAGYVAALADSLRLFDEGSDSWSEVCQLLPLEEP
jgi:hypothetical protein